MKAIQITELGGADKLTLVDIERPEPGPGEILVKIEAAGVKFLDIYMRTGVHPIELPFGLGMEGAGTVEAVSPEVTGFAVGDAVGKATWERSLHSLKFRGMLVIYGNASGHAPPIDPMLLSRGGAGGSLFLTRPVLGHYVSTREELEWRANEILGRVQDGSLKLRTEIDFPLAAAADAHRALEGRRTTGKVLLVP